METTQDDEKTSDASYSEGLTAKQRKEISVGIFSEFLPVAFHQILYARRVYPLEIFAKRKKYGIPVFKACHPGVHDYIANIVESIRLLLDQDAVKRVDLCILKYSGSMVLERFIFELNQLKLAECGDDFLSEVECSLRDTLLKIATCGGVLSPLSDDCTFEVRVHAKESASGGSSELPDPKYMKWIPADVEKEDRKAEALVPLKSVTRSPFLQMQLLIAEAKSLKQSRSGQ